MNTTPRDPESTRQRTVTFITTYRDMMKLNPKVSAAALAKMVGCDNSIPGSLIALGITTEKTEAGRKWLSNATPDEIADMVILHRRKQETRPTTTGESDVVESLRRQLAEAVERIAVLESRPAPDISEPTRLAQDDAELLRLAMNDYANNSARIEQLEKIVGNLLRIQAGALSAPTVAPHPSRKFRIGVVGIYPRDLAHLHAKNVEIVHVEHTKLPAPVIPSGLDAVIVTDDGQKRWDNVKSAYPRAAYRVTGGIKSIATQILIITGQAAHS